MFEKEALELYQKLKIESKKNPGGWQHSPREDWKIDYFPRSLNEFSLVNFRRMPFTDGMISFPDRPLRNIAKPLIKSWIKGLPLWQKVRGIRDILVTMKRLRTVFKFRLSEINDNLVGNPCYYKIGGSRVTDFAIRMCFYRKYIERAFPEVNNVLEIGGGFGGICLKLLSSQPLNVKTYILVELPEIIPLAYWFLRNSNIKVISIISEEDLNSIKDLGNEKTVLLVAPWMLPKIEINFDLLINTMSFQHMIKENLDYYFSEISRLNIQNLFLINGELRTFLGEVNIDNYPIPKKYQLVKQEKYPLTKKGHLVRLYKNLYEL